MGLPNINWINNPWTTYSQWGGANPSLTQWNGMNNSWNNFNTNWSNPYYNYATPSVFGSGSSDSDSNSGEPYEQFLAQTKARFLAPKSNDSTKKASTVFTQKEAEILAEEYKRLIIDPPSQSATSAMGGQAAYGAAFTAVPAINYMRSSNTRKALNPVAKEVMSNAWEQSTWKDFIKPSEAFKENKALNDAVSELAKETGKLERAQKRIFRKKVDSGLYEKILRKSKSAIKSGDIKKIKEALAEARLAKKAKTLVGFRDAKRAARAAEEAAKKATAEAAEKATVEAAEKATAETVTKTATETAKRTGLKAFGKSALKRCSKYVPYIGDAIFAGMEIYGDWDKLKAAKKQGGGALAKQCVHTGVKTAAVVGGFALGMKVGAAIGSCVPIPVVGTLVGAVVGGVVGGLLSWLGAKGAKAATTAALGPEPGVEAQKNELTANGNNNYIDRNGTLNEKKFQNSGHCELITSLASIYAENGTGENGISGEAAQILREHGYVA